MIPALAEAVENISSAAGKTDKGFNGMYCLQQSSGTGISVPLLYFYISLESHSGILSLTQKAPSSQ